MISTRKSLLVVGNDKIGRRCLHELNASKVDMGQIDVAIDRSSDFSRVFRLLLRRNIPLRCLIYMALAEFRRRDYHCRRDIASIYSNDDFNRLISSRQYDKVILFRAGLIINKKNISEGVPIINVHCATIPSYGGLCSIFRAIEDKAYHQEATMHIVTSTIDDDSNILATESYYLDPKQKYKYNEDMAYQAGIKLIINKIDHI